MTALNERLAKMRAERSALVAFASRRNGVSTARKHIEAYERAIRVLMNEIADLHGDAAETRRFEAAVLAAMDAKETT